MAVTSLGFLGLPTGARSVIGPKVEVGLPVVGTAISMFDTWRATYGGASVLVIRADTNERAPLYADPGLTIPLPNPQTLLSMRAEDGIYYGRWAQPVYTYVPYRLTINEANPTGIVYPPLVTLRGEDASATLVATPRGGRLRLLEDALDDLVFAEAFGSLAETNGAEANTSVLEAAIGAAAAQGGGDVILPAGRITFTHLTLPVTVRLRGQGMGVTTLTSTFAGVAITLDGDGSGLIDLTLDGINQTPGSIGVEGIGTAAAMFRNVTVKRFALGIRFRGLADAVWDELYVSDCVRGVDLRGDTDASATGNGGVVRNVTWNGGGVNLCTTAGLALTFFDALTENVVLNGLAITDNLGDGLLLSGARNVLITGSAYIKAAEGERAVKIQDDTNLALRAINTVDHITFRGGIFNGGTMLFSGTCASVAFERADFRGISFDLTVPDEPIVLVNCVEDADTTASGDTTKLMRAFDADARQVVGNTTDAVPTVAWSKTLEPGEVGYFEAEVVAQQQDGIKYGLWHVVSGAYRPGATLDFNLQTANFTAGAILTGVTSGATARIMAVVQSAGSGTLTLGDIEGTFINGEQITDDDGGDARVDGSLVTSNATLDAGGSTDLRTERTTGTYDSYWDVSGAKIRLMVVGDTSERVQWTARVHELAS